MIKFVYFDLGGVAILDFSGTNKWNDLRNEFGMTEEFWAKHYESRLDRGQISKESPIPYDKLLEGFVSRFEKNPSIWPVILAIKERCPVGLLTNMYPGMFDSIKNHGLLPSINWDAIVDSSIERVAKPDRKFFEIAQKRAGVKGREILFVENSPMHVEAAKKLSWQTFLYNPANPEKSSGELLRFFESRLRANR